MAASPKNMVKMMKPSIHVHLSIGMGNMLSCAINHQKIPHCKNLSYWDNIDRLVVLTEFPAQQACQQSAARNEHGGRVYC